MNTKLHHHLAAKIKFALIATISLTMLMAQTFLQIQTDENGANDSSGQGDVTQINFDFFDPNYLYLTMSWDDPTVITASGGGQAVNGCALFDQDGDTRADYALCVEVSDQDGDNAPEVSFTGTAGTSFPQWYSCNNTSSAKCGQSRLIGDPVQKRNGLGATTCVAGNTTTDPFPGGDLYPWDLTVECYVDKSILNDSLVINLCSYPSAGNGGNNSAQDCLVSDFIPFADPGVRIESDIADVELEEFITLTVFASNPGPSPAELSQITIDLPTGLLDFSYAVLDANWSCVPSLDQTQLICSNPLFDITTSDAPIVEFYGRVPGTYSPNSVDLSATIETDTFDYNQFNNDAFHTVPVIKLWKSNPLDISIFNSVTFDQSIKTTSGQTRTDFSSDQLIINPLQVAIKIAPGIRLNQPVLLRTSYCDTYMLPHCDDSTALIEGEMHVISYTISTIEELSAVSLAARSSLSLSPPNLLSTPLTIRYGHAQNGRFSDPRSDKCHDLTTASTTIDHCMTPINDIIGTTHADLYNWSDNELFIFLTQTNNGRQIQCSGYTSGPNCLALQDVQPGLVKFSGEIFAELIFSDARLSADYVHPVSLEYQMYVHLIAPFNETNQNRRFHVH